MYYSQDSSKSVSDRDAIQQLKRDEGIKKRYLNRVRVDEGLTDSWSRIKRELDQSPLGNVSWNPNLIEEIKWWNCSHAKLEMKTGEEKSKPSGVLHSLEDWENMVEFWYSIRNNLFHGGKDPAKERDQIIVEFGYKTLREFVTMLLHEQS